MSNSMTDRFFWCDFEKQKEADLTDAEKYQKLIEWALKARGDVYKRQDGENP